jgi:hypothetical protein
MNKYSDVVEKLLELGRINDEQHNYSKMGVGVNYKELGIGIEHSSELAALLKESEIIALRHQLQVKDFLGSSRVAFGIFWLFEAGFLPIFLFDKQSFSATTDENLRNCHNHLLSA